MTNILAVIVICVVTNVTTEQVVIGNRPTACPATDGYQYGCLVYHCENVYSDTERDRVTTVKEVSTLAFNWLGAQRTVTHERVLSRVVQREQKQDGWEPITLDYEGKEPRIKLYRGEPPKINWIFTDETERATP